MQIFAQGLRGLVREYTKAVDTEVFNFLEKKGYKVTKTKKGAREVKKRLEAEGKAIKIKTINQRMWHMPEGIKYTFDLEIELEEKKSGNN